MEFFLDTANTADIEQYKDLIAGVTTNPSLIAREGRDFKTVVKEITNLVLDRSQLRSQLPRHQK